MFRLALAWLSFALPPLGSRIHGPPRCLGRTGRWQPDGAAKTREARRARRVGLTVVGKRRTAEFPPPCPSARGSGRLREIFDYREGRDGPEGSALRRAMKAAAAESLACAMTGVDVAGKSTAESNAPFCLREAADERRHRTTRRYDPRANAPGREGPGGRAPQQWRTARHSGPDAKAGWTLDTHRCERLGGSARP
jgi:hypothetical protein